MDAMDRFGQELVLAGRRRHPGRRPFPALFGTRFARTSPRIRASAHVRIALLVLALVLATAAITLAATGVILTGSPVSTVRAPIATPGAGLPYGGGGRRARPRAGPDPHRGRGHPGGGRHAAARPASGRPGARPAVGDECHPHHARAHLR